MMAWRAIKDTVPHSVSLSYITAGAERLYWRMLAISDPHGRLEGTPTKVRARALPLVKCTDAQVAHWLEELENVDRIRVYEHAQKRFVELVDFDENQPAEFLRRRGTSLYPVPPPKPPANTNHSGTTPENSGSIREKAGLEGEGEGEGEGENLKPSSTTPAAIGDIYDYWRVKLGKSDKRYDKIAPKRRQKIVARLREFTSEELKRCIDGVALDPWEERSRHDDITIVLRSQEQVEKFLAIAEAPPERRGGLSVEEILAGGETP